MTFLFTVCSLVLFLSSIDAQYIDSTKVPDTTYIFRDSRDGKTYKALRINGLTWMGENLRYNSRDSWCYDTQGGCKQYGRLYSWEEAVTACPKGWHLPSFDEWESLVEYCGGDKLAGKNLARNEYLGFNIVFGFPPNINGRYSKDGTQATFWTADSYNGGTAWVYYFISDKLPLVYTGYLSKNYGMNCRCVKDEAAPDLNTGSTEGNK
jgi:uncharacterized protein (TIGR02145 family)